MARCVRSFRRWKDLLSQFAEGGQLLDLSVALVIGNTFNKVMESLVDYMLTPTIGFLFDGIDIASLSTQLKSDRWPNKTPVNIPYGKFLQQLIYFAVIAITLLLLISIVNSLSTSRRKAQEEKDQWHKRNEVILREHTTLLQTIAQSLKKQT